MLDFDAAGHDRRPISTSWSWREYLPHPSEATLASPSANKTHHEQISNSNNIFQKRKKAVTKRPLSLQRIRCSLLLKRLLDSIYHGIVEHPIGRNNAIIVVQ